MRLLKLFLSALLAIVAVIGGLFTAAVIALASLAVLLTRRLLGDRRPVVAFSTARRARSPRPTAGDTIDISATEVPAETKTLR